MSSANGSVNGLLHEGDRVASGYEVISHLSRGRALDVYDAWSLERDCRCVVKVVRPDRRAPRVRRRLVQEGELLLELAHPHIVRAYELRRRPRTVLVMETLAGETVEHMIHPAPRRLAIADVAHLGLQICSAIGYLHGHGYLHLDVKPSNVIVQSGQARVIDLSLARRPGPVPRGHRHLGDRRNSLPGCDRDTAIPRCQAEALPAARAQSELRGRGQARAGRICAPGGRLPVAGAGGSALGGRTGR